MSSTTLAPNGTQSSLPDASIISSMIARLRAESDAAQSSGVKALLLHELGVLEETLGDEAAAARDHLNAVNAEPEYCEPLERLIAIVQRRQSYKNLGKLLERLFKISNQSDEKARALLELALFRADHEEDLDGARATLEEALDHSAEDSSLWYTVESVACRLGDDGLRARALAARAELTRHPTWRALLLVDLGALLAVAGDGDEAVHSLEQAVDQGSQASFLALQALEDQARKECRDDLLARALVGLNRLILNAIADPAAGDEQGVPQYLRTAASGADASLRAAQALMRGGDLAAASGLLDQALISLPRDAALLHARLSLADLAGDVDAAANVARAQLNQGVTGPFAGSLWLRVAEAAAATGDSDRALTAVRQALVQDPESIPAQALKLDLLGSGQDSYGLASALEVTAEHVTTDEARVRFYLAAADVWARCAQDRQGARAALSQAGMYGASASTLARVSRLLASTMGDAGWYEEATRRLLAIGAPIAEQASLWVELVRSRILRGDVLSASQAVDSLASAPGGTWLAAVMRAYGLPLFDTNGELESQASVGLQTLAAEETNEDVARALRLVRGRRFLASGSLDGAVNELAELQQHNPQDIAAALALASLCQQQNDPTRAAQVLSATADALDDRELAAALSFEAGFLRWRSGQHEAAVENFRAAAADAPTAAATILDWAVPAALAGDLVARRQNLTAEGTPSPRGLAELNGFGAEFGLGGDPDEAWLCLDRMAPDAAPELAAAAQLARATFGRSNHDAAPRLAALDALGDRGPEAAVLARAAEFQLLLDRGASPEDLEEAAARWVTAAPSAESCLEWLGAAMALGDPAREVEARGKLSDCLDPELATAVEAGARLVASLSLNPNQPLLSSSDTVARLTNLELSLPGSDPRRRASALLGLDDSLGEDSLVLTRALAGWSQLAAGDVSGAIHSFRAVTEAYPLELLGWEGLRESGELALAQVKSQTVGHPPSAEANQCRGLIAEACAALGELMDDSAAGAELWERAALILIDELGDPERGEFALSKAVERDVRRFVAFDRLFRRVRDRKDGPHLLELIAARLEVADDPEEIAKLFWERARVMRQQGRIDDALTALENVTLLEPDHVGALALSGEIHIKLGRYSEAAENLARLSELDAAPRQQRLMSGMAAADLYENKLEQNHLALEVLVGLHRASLSTQPVRERLARTAARVGAWEQATEVLEQLMEERDTAAGRIEAARLAMVIHRDRLGSPPADTARPVARLLQESPADGEALDLVLENTLDGDLSQDLALAGQSALIDLLAEDPLQPELVDRLARVAAFLGNAPLRQAALGTLVAVGSGSAEIDQELRMLDDRVRRLPQVVIDEQTLPDLCDPEDDGPIPALFALLAPTLSVALGPGLVAFGVSRKQRVDPRAGLALRNEIGQWAGALGIGEFECYVGGNDERGVYAIPGEPPCIVVGAAITAPLSAANRQLIARELFAIKRGTAILRHRGATEIAAIVVAVCRIAGFSLDSPEYAVLEEFQRLIGKELSRRIRKLLPDAAHAVVASRADPMAFVAAAVSSLDRLAALAAGDVSHVLAASSGTRGQLATSLEGRHRAERLLAFVLSPKYLALREQIGMGVR